jgi:hypothetical protein
MPQSNAKAVALARDLSDKLAKRFAPGAAGLNTVRSAFDANGWPMLFISHNASEAEGQPVVLIRIKNVDAVSKDIFGNATSAYAPHTLELAYELASSNDPEPTLADLEIAKYESQKLGCRYQEKQIANGTAVTEAAINAATPSNDLEDLYWPTKSV